MIAEKLGLIKLMGASAASFLSLAATTAPAATVLLNSKNSTETNVKRPFNSSEESGLDYNVDGPINPFECYSGSTEYSLQRNFYTRANPAENTDYHVLDWSDLNILSKEGLSAWLSQVCNYLGSKSTVYDPKITTETPSSIADHYSYDFSSQQEGKLSLDWRSSQWGFIVQSDEKSYAENQAKAFCTYPQIVQGASEQRDAVTWRSLTGSDFYVNAADENDSNIFHFPHTFNFNIKAQKSSIDLPTWSTSSSNETPLAVSGTNMKFNFVSEEDEEEETTNDLETFDSLSEFIEFKQWDTTTSARSKITLPTTNGEVGYFAFDSNKTYSGSSVTDMLKMFQNLMEEHGYSDDTSLFDNFLGQGMVYPLENQKPIWNKQEMGSSDTYSYFHPNLQSEWVNHTSSSETTNQQKLVLPTAVVEFTIPQYTNKSYVNFVDYYNLSNQNGISCDVDIDTESKELIYKILSGSSVVSTIRKSYSPSFFEFLNLCVSPVQSGATHTAYHTDPNDEEADREEQHNSSAYLKSSDINHIETFHVNVGGSDEVSTSSPFIQAINEDQNISQTYSAQSSGLACSTSNNDLLEVNNDKTKVDPNKLINFAFMSNKIDLNTKLTGSNNQMQTNLDYVLAIDPTTTNFYDKDEAEKTSVKVRLNPYYIQAAANAYSSYNFWLKFAAEHDFTGFKSSENVMKQGFRELIMRGFIKNKAQAEQLYKNLKGRSLTDLLPNKWVSRYNKISSDESIYLNSYTKLSNYIYQPCDYFTWADESFTPKLTIWPDPENPSTSLKTKVSQSSWAPFCWQYGISPSTFSFLKSIPLDYEFVIPYGMISPDNNVYSGTVSSLQKYPEHFTSFTITWQQLLNGEAAELVFDIPEDWNNYSIVIGANNSSFSSLQGIHGISQSTKTITNKDQTTTDITIPNFGNIKLATISNNNHINATGEGYDKNIIQLFSTKANRKQYIKDNSLINYLPSTQTHNILAFNKSDATLTPASTNAFSNNTYVVTKVNAAKAQWDRLEDNYIQIDSDGSTGVILNFSNWRDSVADIENNEYYYESSKSSISGVKNDTDEWLMSGVAPEDWFDDDYKITFNNYTTYKWAFHPSGLWGYNMQYYQDLDKYVADWDDVHTNNDLDYCLWGRPVISIVDKTTYVDYSLQSAWKEKYIAKYGTTPCLYTNNRTHELVFKVTYPDLAFVSESYYGKTITPVQYVYIPDCFYNFGLTQKSATSQSIENFTKTNRQYGDFAPTHLNIWNNDVDTSAIADKKYSTHQSMGLLSPNEIVAFYQSTFENEIYKSNIYYNEFVKLVKNGWIYFEPTEMSNENHSLSFVIHYHKNIRFEEECEKLETINPNYNQSYYEENKIKIPDLTVDPEMWAQTSTITITNFRCIGTEWSTVSGDSASGVWLIGLIVCCCITPILIGVTGWGLHRTRTKYKRIK